MYYNFYLNKRNREKEYGNMGILDAGRVDFGY